MDIPESGSKQNLYGTVVIPLQPKGQYDMVSFVNLSRWHVTRTRLSTSAFLPYEPGAQFVTSHAPGYEVYGCLWLVRTKDIKACRHLKFLSSHRKTLHDSVNMHVIEQ